MRVLITGGAGFVGSALARYIKARQPGTEVIAFDNLRRRGSEINVDLHQRQGIRFVHGDIRARTDLFDLDGAFDLMIEASAEPSVLAGTSGSPNYVLDTNLTGTLNCLEFARQRVGGVVFLSTSRVYSIEPLRRIPLAEAPTRFTAAREGDPLPGFSAHGIAETFPTHLARSIYGATKLASEMVIQEYVATYGMRAVINRCGVIAGPGQFGKVDQGVFTMWVANHYFGKPLKYVGFGGQGKQVRDLLHPEDLGDLIERQVAELDRVSGEVFNVGGGLQVSTSLLELTKLCQETIGRSVPVGSEPATSPVDIPYYVSDCRQVEKRFGWRPSRDVDRIVGDIHQWIKVNEDVVRKVFC